MAGATAATKSPVGLGESRRGNLAIGHCTKRLLLLTICTQVVLPSSLKADDWIPQSKGILLDMLKAKDAQFDNATVVFERHEVRTVNPLFEWAKQVEGAGKAGIPAPDLPEILPEIRSVEVVTGYQLTIKKSETTLESWRVISDDGEEPKKEESTGSKTTNIGGLQTNMVTTFDSKILHEDPRPFDPNGLLAEDRMFAEFCLGVGFGSRIQSIEAIATEGDLAAVDATMKLWGNDVTKAHLLIDRDFLVRKAELLADSGDQTRLEIRTEGKVDSPSGKEIASKGIFRRVALTAMVNGQKIGLNDRVDADYSIVISDARFDLSLSEYETLVSIDRESATRVVNMLPLPPTPRPTTPVANGKLIWLLVVNGLIVVILGIYLMLRRKRNVGSLSVPARS